MPVLALVPDRADEVLCQNNCATMPVLALVPDRADEVLCQNSWKLSSDCFVHEEQLRFMLSANSVVKVSDQVQTLSVGCDTSCCFCIFMSL